MNYEITKAPEPGFILRENLLEFLNLLSKSIFSNKDLINKKFIISNNRIIIINNKNYLEYISTPVLEGEMPWVFINDKNFKRTINGLIQLLKGQKQNTRIIITINKKNICFTIKDREEILSTSRLKLGNVDNDCKSDIIPDYGNLLKRINLPFKDISGDILFYVDKQTYEFLWWGLEDDDPLVGGLLFSTSLALEHNTINKRCNDFIVFRFNNLELPSLHKDNMKISVSLYKKGKLFNVEFLVEYGLDYHYKVYKCKPTNDYPKIIHLPNQYQELHNINRLKFTVRNNDTNFSNELNLLIDRLSLVEIFSNRKRKQYIYKLNQSIINESIQQFKKKYKYEGLDLEYKEFYIEEFFSLTITNAKDYTFAFYNLEDYEYFKIINEYIKIKLKNEMNFSINPSPLNPKLQILNEILYFLYSKGLYSQTKIKGLGINICFTDAKQFDQLRLLEFTTSKQKDLYKYFPVEKNKTMYTKPFSFKANIQKTEAIIKKYLSKIKRGPFYNKEYSELSSNEIKEILFLIFQKKFRKASISVGSESVKRAKYYVLINNVPVKRFDEPVNILDEFDITFKSTIDKNTNFIEAHRNRIVKHIDGSSIGCYNFTLNINKWHTDSKKTSKELNSDDGDFRLNDSLEMIMDNINQFTSKYKLLLVKDNESKEDIENNVTNISKIKYFDKMLDKEKDIPDFIEKSEEHIYRQLKALLIF